YSEYWKTGVVPADAGELLFLATWSSGGTIARTRAAEHAAPFDAERYVSFPDKLLSHVDPRAVADDVETNGFHIVPERLPTGVVDDILDVLDRGPAQPRGDGLLNLAPGPPGAAAPTWWMDPSDIVRSEAARQMLRERRLAEAGG